MPEPSNFNARDALDRSGMEHVVASRSDDGGANSVWRSDAAIVGVVHDLNNLLTIVLGSLEQLRRQPLDERGHQQLARADWAAEQAGRLAGQVLAGSDAPAASLEAIDLNEAVATFAASLGQIADWAGGRPARFAVQLARGPLPVQCDRARLEAALLNLVRNAADATSGGGSVTVSTAGNRMDGLGDRPVGEVTVSDTGPGMPPEVVLRATDAFFTTKGPERGAGLGLWMVERFAADSDGKVAIETSPGQGTTVRISLPLCSTKWPSRPVSMSSSKGPVKG